MKIYLIPDDKEVTLKFSYKGESSEMNMKVYYKTMDKLFIPAIKDGDRPLYGKELKDVTLIYNTEQGVYEFKELKIGIVKCDGRYVYSVQSDYDATRENRREAFRVDIGHSLNVTIQCRNKDDITTVGVLKDISAVGMAVVLRNNIEEDALLRLVFNINDTSYVTLVGEIVRKEKVPNKRYLYGCKFDERSEMLGKIILKRQLDYRRRGLKI